MTTGYMLELLHLPERSTSDQELVSDFSLTFMDPLNTPDTDSPTTLTLEERSSDGDSNNSKSLRSSRKTRRVKSSRSTPESSPRRE